MSGPSLLRVTVEEAPGSARRYEFRQTFTIGRAIECDISINNTYVSRTHVEGSFENGSWQLRDLNSSNGLFLAGERVPFVRVPPDVTIRLGVGGPFLSVTAEQVPVKKEPRPGLTLVTGDVAPPAPAAPQSPGSLTGYVERYFGEKTEGPAGEHTVMVRRAFAQVQKKQKSRWLMVVGALLLVTLGLGGYALYEHRQGAKQLALAQGIFYSMKALDVDIANFERVVLDTNHEGVISQLGQYRQRRRETEERYNRFVAALKLDDSRLTPRQRVIVRVARIFGECDLAIPADFEAEVNKYIQRWKSTGRLSHALARARENNYLRPVSNELLAVGLPPQFAYLALQESDFDPYISGPMTRKGIAKGMWQFIPETAVKYGMRIGPLVNFPRPDPGDDRHHWERETKAAARYMKDLYSTDAQASGLLVMACYNWGEDRVLPLVRSLPPNPEERNFWKLLARYRDKLPQETYDYVFSIVAAAVIGEDPHLFGFDFDNPLAAIP